MTEEEIEYFDRKYDNVTNKKYVSVGEYRLARYGISNMLGGIGYWYGNQIWKLPGMLYLPHCGACHLCT